MLKRSRIPCYVIIFDQVDIIKKTLNFLTNYSKWLDIIVMENCSSNSPEISKFVEGLGKKRLIKRYYFFEKNIVNSAFTIVTDRELETIKKSPFVMLTDGDLTSDSKNWLKEEINILKHHKDVFACGVTLDMSNLPLKTFPEAKDWIPPDISEESDFYQAITGAHLLLLRGKELWSFIKWKNENNIRFVDSEMHKYCYDILNKKWTRTKDSKAYHLTWDLYNDKSHPYTKFRQKKSHVKTWYQVKSAPYILKEY